VKPCWDSVVEFRDAVELLPSDPPTMEVVGGRGAIFDVGESDGMKSAGRVLGLELDDIRCWDDATAAGSENAPSVRSEDVDRVVDDDDVAGMGVDEEEEVDFWNWERRVVS